MNVQLTGLAEKRRPVLKHEEFDSSPLRLRTNLEKFDGLLEGSNTWLRRRVLLSFGTLVSEWQRAHRPHALCMTLELLPRAVRMRVEPPQETLDGSGWDELVTPGIEGLVEAWGVDLRGAGGAWFEFWEVRGETPLTRPPLRFSGVAKP